MASVRGSVGISELCACRGNVPQTCKQNFFATWTGHASKYNNCQDSGSGWVFGVRMCYVYLPASRPVALALSLSVYLSLSLSVRLSFCPFVCLSVSFCLYLCTLLVACALLMRLFCLYFCCFCSVLCCCGHLCHGNALNNAKKNGPYKNVKWIRGVCKAGGR